MHIAYLMNSYPAVSHAFIRREIRGLEAIGSRISRIALRGWDNPLVDPEDAEERSQTRYVMQRGLIGLVWPSLMTLFRNPRSFYAAVRFALRLSSGADRSLAIHLGYVLEACCVKVLIDRSGAQHLHTHFGTNSAAIAALVRVIGGPAYSLTIHGPNEFDAPLALHLREKIEGSAFTVAITDFCRSQLLRWLELKSWSKVRVVRCGIEPALFDVPLALESPLPKFVCLGRLVEQKGQLLLLEAVHQMVKEGHHFELVVVGAGPMREILEARVEELGLSSCVRLTGALSTKVLEQEFRSSRGLVLPSFAEGLPMVFMEAMAMGLPVLTTQIAGHPELVRHGENGWLFAAGSADAIADALRDCLSRPIDELRAMGAAGRELARRLHSSDRQARELHQLFADAIAGRH